MKNPVQDGARSERDPARGASSDSASGLSLERLSIAIPLPPLGGEQPPPRCPFCGAERVPPESDDGLPPPEQHVYLCGSSYGLPDDPALPQLWEPRWAAGCPTPEQSLAFVRDRSGRAPELAGVHAAISAVVEADPLYPAKEKLPLQVSLPRDVLGERPPERCPICSAPVVSLDGSLQGYRCGALYMVSSARPDGRGGLVPESWVAMGACESPPLSVVLGVIQRKAEAQDQPRLAAACAEARERLLAQAPGAE